MRARNARRARPCRTTAPAAGQEGRLGAIGQQTSSEARGAGAHGERRPGREQAPPRDPRRPLRRPFATRNSSLAPPRALQRPGSSAAYENATNVNRNAADTIHMSGLTSRQWPRRHLHHHVGDEAEADAVGEGIVNGMPMMVTNAGMAASRLPQSILPMSLIIR